MGWQNYSSEAALKEISEVLQDSPLTLDYLGKDTIKAVANLDISINGRTYEIRNLEGQTTIGVRGPTLMTNDGLYILTFDNKFINVRREEENG